ncbi:hypothetical protein BZM26_37755 [Paraburkholderia strydomiana]|nr:hypothetical protein BZM26_37755 [Paraburkholderia strydomiana]
MLGNIDMREVDADRVYAYLAGNGLVTAFPKPRILRPWRDQRFAVKHSKQEPGARIGHAGIFAWSVQQWSSYRDKFRPRTFEVRPVHT